MLLRGNGWPDEAAIRALIVESLQAGRPVITLGVAGPPEAELVTGYDENGAVLMGWSFFQEMPEFSAGLAFEPTGEFRARDWYSGMKGLITLGDKAQACRALALLRGGPGDGKGPPQREGPLLHGAPHHAWAHGGRRALGRNGQGVGEQHAIRIVVNLHQIRACLVRRDDGRECPIDVRGLTRGDQRTRRAIDIHTKGPTKGRIHGPIVHCHSQI